MSEQALQTFHVMHVNRATCLADAALAAIKPAGYAAAPAEPTARMCVAGPNERDNGDGELRRRKYRAMVEAAEALA
ncbi:MAG: hypothetical protein V7664_00265 [Qipengyuania sp.]|uniref:hypothetical protein n=1 Tax=Qipengyuania sp. TaxID=2004515 RepID=UPI0030023465